MNDVNKVQLNFSLISDHDNEDIPLFGMFKLSF